MTSTARFRTWLVLVPIMIVALVVGGLSFAQPAAAADNPISGNQTKEQALGIGPNGNRVCATWSTFDYSPNAVFVRIYDTPSQSWTSGSFEVTTSGPANTGKSKCAIDAAGNTHVVWQECSGSCRIAYRFLPVGGNPGNSGSWSQVITIETDRDGPDIDALYSDPNGKVWLAYRQYPGSFQLRNWSQSGGWSSPETVNTGNDNAEKVRIGVDNAGYVSLAWRQGNDGVGYVWRDTNGYISPVSVISGSGGAGLASLAVDKVTGDVHIIYPKDFTSLNYVKKTGPIGTSFSGQRTIINGDNQILEPRIAWAPTGRLIVAFDNGNKARIEAVISEDRGGSFGGAFTLTSRGNTNAPWVVADSGGGGYVAYNSGGVVYFTTIGGTGPIATPSPTPSPTPTPNPPVISNVGAVPSTLNSVTVNWNTDTPSTSRVFFSTVGVDTACSLPSCTAGDAELTTTHSVTLRNLSPNTIYNYQVRATDAFGQATLDPTVRSFTTNSLEIVGNGKTPDGKFSALLYVPAGTQQVQWTSDSTNYTTINYTVTNLAQVVAFYGDLTRQDPAPAQTFQVVVRYNGQAGQVSTTATIQYDPAFKSGFSDVAQNSASPYAIAINELQGRGMVQGSNGLFRPLDPIARAEAAAIVARSLTWVPESGASSFSDRGSIDDELWDNVQVLADYGVAQGFGDGTFQPTGNVAQAQIISLVTRAMVAKGYWDYQNDNGTFPNVPASSGHRVDIITFNFYTGGSLNDPSFFTDAGYATTAERRFVARIVYEAVKYRESQVNGAAIYEVP